ncbi:MAG: cyclic nucleotide-binding domain-containing protein [Streptosporangiaceae bacterium]|nr:cyclic nucleotide-binding domain-containing protein [Streptosporangiaceae bacterium]
MRRRRPSWSEPWPSRSCRAGEHPVVRELPAGEFLFRQAEPGTSLAVILDGTFEVLVDGKAVGQVGPGTVVGERASLEAGRRTSDLRALTEARVAEAAPGLFSAEQLSELAHGHHREDGDRA